MTHKRPPAPKVPSHKPGVLTRRDQPNTAARGGGNPDHCVGNLVSNLGTYRRTVRGCAADVKRTVDLVISGSDPVYSGIYPSRPSSFHRIALSASPPTNCCGTHVLVSCFK